MERMLDNGDFSSPNNIFAIYKSEIGQRPGLFLVAQVIVHFSQTSTMYIRAGIERR